MGECNSSLNWAAESDPGRRFEPRKTWSSSAPLGVYEVFQDGRDFDAWFTSEDSGVLVFLGRSETANGARRRCDQHAKKWGSHAHPA